MKHDDLYTNMTEHLWLLPGMGLKLGMRGGEMAFYMMFKEERMPSSSNLNSKILTLDLYQSLFYTNTSISLSHFILGEKVAILRIFTT